MPQIPGKRAPRARAIEEVPVAFVAFDLIVLGGGQQIPLPTPAGWSAQWGRFARMGSHEPTCARRDSSRVAALLGGVRTRVVGAKKSATRQVRVGSS